MTDLDYESGSGETAASYPSLDEKLEKAFEVIDAAMSEYTSIGILWTGGKDSTLLSFLVKEVCEQHNYDKPPVFFIDHGRHFTEMETFVDKWASEWGFTKHKLRNEDVLLKGGGGKVTVDQLNEQNQSEVKQLVEGDISEMEIELGSAMGSHLLKTVPLNSRIESAGVEAVFSGIRWDEQPSRSDETFFSSRSDSSKYPPHDRVHPILQFDEQAVWDAFWFYVAPKVVDGFSSGFVPASIGEVPVPIEEFPVCVKYFEGYRSIGSKDGTTKTSDDPAWVQELSSTNERAGRSEKKENVMDVLRELGYM